MLLCGPTIVGPLLVVTSIALPIFTVVDETPFKVNRVNLSHVKYLCEIHQDEGLGQKFLDLKFPQLEKLFDNPASTRLW